MHHEPIEMSPGEIKAIRRENHLCEHCHHCCVCKIATNIDSSLLIIVSQCLAFEPETESIGATCA